MQALIIGVTWGVSIIVGLFMVTILVLIWLNRIDLQYLISEEDGSASLSRFQLLIFTFVIAISYFLLVIATVNAGTGLTLPDVPSGTLTLLGISGGSYVLSKTIQKVAETSQSQQSGTSGGGNTGPGTGGAAGSGP